MFNQPCNFEFLMHIYYSKTNVEPYALLLFADIYYDYAGF